LEFFIPRTMLGHGCGRQIRQAIEQEDAVDLSLLTSHGEDEPIVASVRQKAARMRKARSLTFEGVFFVRQGRLENGLPLLKRAARLDPDNAEAHYHLGIALGQSGKARSGVDHLEAAVRLDPNKVDARYNLAKIRAEQGRLEAAVKLYARILAIRPRFAEARYLLGQVLVRLGRFDEAIREFREVLEFDPDDREVRDAMEEARTHLDSTNEGAPG
jgi:tetratricopeptide (TPR) repeat protein